MEANSDIFVATLLIAIGFCSLILGLLIVKFASGDTKKTGMFTLVMGVVFLLSWVVVSVVNETYAMEIIFWDAFLAILGALLGAAAAFMLFLGAIMYS